MMKRVRAETWIATASGALAVAAVLGALYSPPVFWQPLLLNLAATFFGAAIAIFIVNLYLHRQARKEAVKSLLKLIGPPVEDYHNTFLRKGHDAFGKDHFGELQERYINANGDPAVFTPEERHKIYSIVKKNKATLDAQLHRLDRELKVFAFILGWSFDARILATAFDCRHAIVQMADLQFDDSDDTKKEACELFLDAHLYSSRLFGVLVDLVGIPPGQVYSARSS